MDLHHLARSLHRSFSELSRASELDFSLHSRRGQRARAGECLLGRVAPATVRAPAEPRKLERAIIRAVAQRMEVLR